MQTISKREGIRIITDAIRKRDTGVEHDASGNEIEYNPLARLKDSEEYRAVARDWWDEHQFGEQEPWSKFADAFEDDFGYVARPLEGERPLSSAVATRDPGGAPPRWDWDSLPDKLALKLSRVGLPENKAELVKIVQKLLAASPDNEPDELTVRKHLERKFPTTYAAAGKNHNP